MTELHLKACRQNFTQMFKAALDKKWKPPKCPSPPSDKQNMMYPYNGYYSYII